MPSLLSALIECLRAAIVGNHERTNALERVLSGREPTTYELPLIHRTGKPTRGNTLERIFKERRLRPPEQPGPKKDGLNSAVYFFYGAGTFPKGRIAFVFSSKIAKQYNSTFAPFDTGAVLASPPYLEPIVYDPNWHDPKVRGDFLAKHTGHGADLNVFAPCYLATHFREPSDYVTRPQQSVPDWQPFHGLRCIDEDRRAWTIEARIPHTIPLKHVQAIILDDIVRGNDLQKLIGDKYAELVTIRRDASGDFGQAIAKFVFENMLKPQQQVKRFPRLIDAIAKFIRKTL